MTIDEKWLLWQRNVVDKYKDIPTEEIKADLIANKLPVGILLSHIEGDLNIGNIIRTANSFRMVDIFYYGKKKIDVRSMCGAGHYVNITYLTSINEIIDLKKIYPNFVGIDNNLARPILNIKNFVWPDLPLICFGEEGRGMTESLLDIIDYIVEIPTLGSVRSMNVASAAACCFFDFTSKNGYL